VLLIVLPLVLGHGEGWPAWCFGCMAAGVVLAAGFVLVERRVAARGGDPLLNLAVLRAPALPSGLLTTTVQLGQLLGVAALGSVYLSRAAGSGSSAMGRAAASAAAMSGTACWLAALSVAGLLAAAVMVRAARGR
jgi:hypothetical protein